MGKTSTKKNKEPLIQQHGATLLALSKAPEKFRKVMIKHAPNEVINCVAECCHNVLKGNVPLSSVQKQQLHPKRQHLRNLANKKVSIKKKKKILNQKGGFLPAFLLPALAPVIAKTIVGKIVDKI